MAANSPAERGPRRSLTHSLIVFGYGNPGRQDDGLGPAAVDAITHVGWPSVTTQWNYQLNIEDADEASKHDCVVFVDAAAAGLEPYEVQHLQPSRGTAFSTHLLSPEVLLAICRDYYGRVPPAVLVAIRGYAFDFGEGLTPRARQNLQEAIEYIKRLVFSRSDGELCRAESEPE